MSEQLIIDDDPDPLSGSVNGYRINLQTGKAYDGYELSHDLSKREAEYFIQEAKEQEKRAVGYLSTTADRILRDYDAKGDNEDSRVYDPTGEIFLRRRRFERRVHNGGTFDFSMYFFVDRSNGQNYCRSWWSEAGVVNWCQEESRHEPAADVTARLDAAFPRRDEDSSRRNRFGGGVLARLVRL